MLWKSAKHNFLQSGDLVGESVASALASTLFLLIFVEQRLANQRWHKYFLNVRNYQTINVKGLNI